MSPNETISMQALISVIIPAFNRPAMLERAVRSVLEQKYNHFELIVVDDGSEEDLSVVRELVQNAGHRFLTRSHGGVAAARNTGIKLSAGDWICLLDSDDFWYENKLKQQLEFHQEHSQFLISQTLEDWYRQDRFVNKQNKYFPPEGDVFQKCCEMCCISPSSVMLHKSIIESVGYFDEDYIACEDYEFWLRVSSKYVLAVVPEILIRKHAGHEDQLSRTTPVLDWWRARALIKNLLSDDYLESQQGIMKQQLLKKLEILQIGAKKRQLTSSIFYQSMSLSLSGLHWKQGLLEHLKPFLDCQIR